MLKKLIKLQKSKKIQEQEQKLEKIFTKQITNVPESVFEQKQTKFFDNSSNNNSNNNNSNNSNNSNNVEIVRDNEDLVEESEEANEVKIELEYDNLKEYFTEMRARYDPELFISQKKNQRQNDYR